MVRVRWVAAGHAVADTREKSPAYCSPELATRPLSIKTRRATAPPAQVA